MKVMKEAEVVVERLDGVDNWPKEEGGKRSYLIVKADIDHKYLMPHEKKMVVGLKPGQKRTVHLVMTWEDDK